MDAALAPPPPPGSTPMPPMPPPGQPPFAQVDAPPPGQPPPPGFGTPPPPANGDGGPNTKLLVAIGVVVALVAATIGYLALSGDDDATTTAGGETGTTQLAAGEVFLESSGGLGPDPFTASPGDAGTVTPTAVTVQPATSTSTTTTLGGPDRERLTTLRGGEPGLYGGTEDQASCDRQLLVNFLEANPDKAAAWVAAQRSDGVDITVATVDDYVLGLTPTTLLEDTRVTNNGFRNGAPTPRQAVLERGTAVLVDDLGVPRARCACGNPLLSPAPVEAAPTYAGQRWPAFTETRVVVVREAPRPLETFVLTSLDTGDTFERPVGTGGEEDGGAIPDALNLEINGSLSIPPPGRTESSIEASLTIPVVDGVAQTTAATASGTFDGDCFESESGDTIETIAAQMSTTFDASATIMEDAGTVGISFSGASTTLSGVLGSGVCRELIEGALSGFISSIFENDITLDLVDGATGEIASMAAEGGTGDRFVLTVTLTLG